MALAEARAAWQRTANRCLVQEDAKRAPKLACCSSMAPSVIETPGGQDIIPLPFDCNPWYYSSSKWWLQMPPTYGYQKGLLDQQFISLDRSWKIQETSAWNEDQTPHFQSSLDNQCRNLVTCEKKDISVKEAKIGGICNWNCQDNRKLNAKEDFGELSDECFLSDVSKCSSDVYFDSESSWIGGAKNGPWWRTANAEELALLVAQRSHDLIDNCDLPRPQNARSKKGHDASSHHQKPSTANVQYLHTRNHKPGNPTAKLRMTVGDQSAASLRHITVHKKMTEAQAAKDQEDDTSKARLLEALRHSQTRAREAEQVAKQACAEKEHVIKLVLRQASQLFAYKQWIQLVQLENMYFQYKNGESREAAAAASTYKASRKRSRLSRYDSVVFTVGLGLIGAGLLLGWSIGWFLRTCR